MDIEDFLNGGEPADAPEPVDTEEPAQPEPVSQPRDESGRFAPKGEPAPEPEPAAPPAVEDRVPTRALQEERRQRQQAQAEAAELKRRIEAFEQAQQAQPIPSVYEDEDGYTNALLERAALAAQQRLAPEFQRQLAAEKIELRRELMRERHDDFETVEASFFEMAAGNPALLAEMNRQENPVRWVYDTAKKMQEVQRLGSLDLNDIRAKIRAELEAEMRAPTAPAPSVPTSLADQQSARLNASVYAPPTLADILSRK